LIQGRTHLAAFLADATVPQDVSLPISRSRVSGNVKIIATTPRNPAAPEGAARLCMPQDFYE
jgi:hypothetical protein